MPSPKVRFVYDINHICLMNVIKQIKGTWLYMAYPLSSGSVTSLSDILSYTDAVNWIIGASKTGKTTFLSRFIGSLPRGKDIYLLDTSGKFVHNELAQIESVNVLPANSQLSVPDAVALLHYLHAVHTRMPPTV